MKGRSGNGMLRCPTRPEGQPKALISHLITRDLCLQRQREFFHKCPTCVNSMQWQARSQEQKTLPLAKA